MKDHLHTFVVEDLPPSVNNLWRKGKDRMGRDKWYKDSRAIKWTARALAAYLEQRPGVPLWEKKWPLKGLVSVRVDLFDTPTKGDKKVKFWDLDNRLKVILDSLTEKEARSRLSPILKDDSLIWDIEVHRHQGERQQTIITITQACRYRKAAIQFCRNMGLEWFAQFFERGLPEMGV